MPELPEVETIRIGLQKYLLGFRIQDIVIRLAKQFTGDPENVIDAEIIGVRRFGKGLVIDLDNKYSLAVHVKMTGQMLFAQQNRTKNKEQRIGNFELPDKYTHVIFALKNKNGGRAFLYYRDIRQFGWIRVVKTDEVKDLPFFRSLGREPLKDLTLEGFEQLVKRAKTPIKLLLMDQAKIAGIGNIYANDALFSAKIHPKRPANSLSNQEITDLFHAIESVLKKSIAAGGASANNYINVLGEKGAYQEHFLVYKKDGKACRLCGEEIKKIRLGGRGTFYCPGCQR